MVLNSAWFQTGRHPFFFSFFWHIKLEYTDYITGTGEKSWREVGRRRRTNSALKQQANARACIPLISKRELMALMLRQVIISPGNSGWMFAVQGRERPDVRG